MIAVLSLHSGGCGFPGVAVEVARAQKSVVVPTPFVRAGGESRDVEGHDTTAVFKETLEGSFLIITLGPVVKKQNDVIISQFVVVHSVPVSGGFVGETICTSNSWQISVSLLAETDMGYIPSAVVESKNPVCIRSRKCECKTAKS